MAATLRTSTAASGTEGELAHLLIAARAGDRLAHQQLLTAVRPVLERMAKRHCRSSCDVDDVVQEAWMTVLTKLDQLQCPEAIYGWLRRVTINTANAYGRRSARSMPQDGFGDDAIDPAGDEPGAAVERADLIAQVRRALGRLSAADRTLLSLLSTGDTNAYRIASQQLGRPVGSLGPTRQRALARLRTDPAIAALAAA